MSVSVGSRSITGSVLWWSLLAVAGSTGLLYFTNFLFRNKLKPNKIDKDNNNNDNTAANNNDNSGNNNVVISKEPARNVTVLYGTCMGTAKRFAMKIADRISVIINSPIEAMDLKDYDEDALEQEDIVLIICSTWTDGEAPETAALFYDWLKDVAVDFRVSKNLLSKVHYGVFGLGGDTFGENFCRAPLEIHNCMETLGGNPICAPGKGNDAGDIEADFNKWSSNVLSFINKIANPNGNDDSLLAWNVSEDGDGYASKRTIRKARKAKLKAEGKLGKKRLPPVAEYAELSDVSSSNIAWNAPSNSKIGGYQATTTSDTQSEYESSIAGDDSSVAGSEYSAANGSVMMNEDEMEEEDRINLQFVTMDNIEDNAGSGQCCNSHSDKGSCSHHHEVKPIVAPIEGDESDEDEPTDSGSAEAKVSSVLDLEDIGSAMDQAKKSQLKEAMSETKNSAEMVTKLQRKALAKEGYRIIGTHSAVKLCRWTKHQMRGRGGCYKHTFYGITSYQCMEATPSLACANKCVFCWRHHKNPVGTEWRWKEDAPDMIVEEAILQHQSMINQMKGVPGVLPERWKEAFTVRHCALSLVGEPIMYPRINEMLKELHDRQISTFLVTNAQFPERIKQLDPVTQLYVSVDAASKDSMKAIDRPLFKDFWERFLQSLYEMRSKQQRTVYRMTLVNDWNMEEVEGYVQLIESGQPDFIEVKSVTYCGKSDASSLTMAHVPWHREVCAYCEVICEQLNKRGVSQVKYSIATEHEHSCCVLIAREDKFKINNEWCTWIDYPKYDQLIQDYYSSNGKKTFISSDYIAKTPEWALYKSKEHGFDPIEQRYRKTKAGKLVEIEYKSTESGCG